MAGMDYRQCFESASRAAGRQLSDDEFEDVWQKAQGRRNVLRERYGLSDKAAAIRAGTELGAEHRARAKMEAITRAKDLQTRVATRMWISHAAENELKGKTGPDLERAVRARLFGTDTPLEGGKMSTEGLSIAGQKEYAASLVHALGNDLAAARSGAMDRDIRREMYELSNKTDTGQFPGVSGNKTAARIARVFHDHLALVRQRLNDKGAWIGHLDDYVMNTAHDQTKIYRSGFEAWRDFIAPRLDMLRVYEGVKTPEEIEGSLRNTWDALATGVHMSDAGGIGFKPPEFSGPGNMAKKLSQSRSLHFKDADAWGQYMDRFGTSGNMLEHVTGTLRRGASQDALMTHWGTNPQAEFDNTIKWLKEKYKPGATTTNELTAAEGRLRGKFGDLTGENNQVQNKLGAQLASGARNIEVASKLGAVLFTHMSATTTAAREMQRAGDSYLGSYTNALTSWLGGFQGKAAQEMKDVMAAALEGGHTALTSSSYLSDTMPGTMSKLTNAFMKLTGLPKAVDWKQSMVAAGKARILARQLDKGYDDLIPETKYSFKQYGVSPAEWDALRGVTDHFQNSNNQTLLLPDAAMRSGLDPKQARALAVKLGVYYSDSASRATISPRIEDRHARLFFRGNSQPGTVAGELSRFVSQFKTWPTAMVRQSLSAEMNMPTKGGAAAGITQLILGMAVFGHLRAVLNSWARGQTAPSLSDPREWANAIVQGGGAGIYGDFLFGQHNSYGGGIMDSLAGPVLGQTDAVAKIWNELKDYAVSGGSTKLGNVGADATHLVKNNTPFINLFWARSALDYLLFNSMQETMNPGYLQRAQNSLRKRTGQGYLSPQTPGVGWMNPSQHLQTFGR